MCRCNNCVTSVLAHTVVTIANVRVAFHAITIIVNASITTHIIAAITDVSVAAITNANVVTCVVTKIAMLALQLALLQ